MLSHNILVVSWNVCCSKIWFLTNNWLHFCHFLGTLVRWAAAVLNETLGIGEPAPLISPFGVSFSGVEKSLEQARLTRRSTIVASSTGTIIIFTILDLSHGRQWKEASQPPALHFGLFSDRQQEKVSRLALNGDTSIGDCIHKHRNMFQHSSHALIGDRNG